MALATTERYEELIVEVEFDPVGASGTYTSICGLKDATITRQSNVDTEEVGDCSDESLPFAVTKSVRSIEMMISGTGTWAQESHSKMLAWWRSASTFNVRVRNTAVASGQIEIEAGDAFLTRLNNQRTKGKVVSADIQIEFETLPTTTNKS